MEIGPAGILEANDFSSNGIHTSVDGMLLFCSYICQNCSIIGLIFLVALSAVFFIMWYLFTQPNFISLPVWFFTRFPIVKYMHEEGFLV